MTCPSENQPAHIDCRTRLIQAAADAFMEKGYRASVDNIAERAGVARQTLYNNFANKEELFREVGASLAESLAAELCLERDGLQQTLYRFSLELRKRTLSDKGIAIYRSFLVEGARVPEMAAAIHGRVTDRVIEILSEYMSWAMASGELRKEEPKFAAEMLISMLIHGDRIRRLACAPLLNEKDNEQRTQKIIECFLRAFKPE